MLIAAWPSHAAIAEIGASRTTGACQNVQTCASGNVTVTSGNLLVCGGSNWDAVVNTITGIADTVTSSWTLKSVSTPGPNFRAWLSYAKAAAGGTNAYTLTLTSSASFATFACSEFSGTASSPLDVDPSAATGTSTTAAITFSTGVANALIVGVVGHDTGSTVTINPNGSYTQIGEDEDNSAHTAYNLEYRIVTTATSYTTDWTLGSSTDWQVEAYSFKPASGSRSRCVGCGADQKVIGDR